MTFRPPALPWIRTALSLWAAISVHLYTIGSEPELLDLDRIYEAGEFSAKDAGGKWAEDGTGWYQTKKNENGGSGQNIVFVDARTGEEKIVVDAADLVPRDSDKPLAIDGYSFDRHQARILIYTNSQRVWRHRSRGDYWVLDRAAHELIQLGGSDASDASLMRAKFSPDGRAVAYVRNGNIYLESLLDHTIQPLTNSPPQIRNGTFDWVYEEEFGLLDGFRFSPNGKKIAFWQLDTSGVRTFTLVDNTNGLYQDLKQFAYPKSGQTNAACRIGIVDIDSGDVDLVPLEGDPRNTYVAYLEWIPDSTVVLLQQLNRLQNENRLLAYDTASGQLRTVLEDRDDAWVDVVDELPWLVEGQRLIWTSEKDGWRHLYAVDVPTGQQRLLTDGRFDVEKIDGIDVEREIIYFTASPDNATQRYLYCVDFRGENLRRVTPAKATGTHTYSISPNGRLAIHRRSSASRPPVINLVRLPRHRPVRMLERNDELRKQLKELKQPRVEFFQVPIDTTTSLDAWAILPPDLAASLPTAIDVRPSQDETTSAKKYPLLVYVYGEPAGSTVRDQWGGNGQLWHWMLAQQGYVVMSFDNRGTNVPRGRQWRKSIYRQVGILAPGDQASAVRQVLKDRPYLDPTRVGVWGWSGGGSMTLNAMLKYPELYKAGISVAPVPNQRFYDTIYQERYMGLPDDNVEGYLQGSAINFANQLQGNLLLIHGTGDDNCHYQGTETLINALIKHKKPFTMMAYPNRSHSISEGDGTTYHLRQLMTNYLHNNL